MSTKAQDANTKYQILILTTYIYINTIYIVFLLI